MDRSETISSGVARRYAGKWVAWNRSQTRIVGSGRTFDEAKRAAALGGEMSVILGLVPSSKSWWLKSRRLIHMVAVFISLGQATLNVADVPASPLDSSAQVADVSELEGVQDAAQRHSIDDE